MCIHRFYIFEACGHHFFSPDPLVACEDATERHGGPLTPIPVTPSTSQFLPITAQMKRIHAVPLKQVSFARGGQPGCEPNAHPFQTFRLDSMLCGACLEEKYRRMGEANALLGRVCVDESKWKAARPNPTKSILPSPEQIQDEKPKMTARELRHEAQQAHTRKRISQSSALSISPIDENSLAAFEDSIHMEAGRTSQPTMGHTRQISESKILIRKGGAFRNSVLMIESSLYKFGESFQ